MGSVRLIFWSVLSNQPLMILYSFAAETDIADFASCSEAVQLSR